VFVELYRKSEDLKCKNAELERAEKELIRSKAAASVIQHAPDPVFVSDVHGKILHANDAVSELLGLRSEELLEQSLAEFLSPEETKRFADALRTVVQEGAKRDVKLHPKNSVGEITPTMLNASALRNAEGKVVGAIGILRDMTAHERLVRELEHSRASLLDKIKELQKFEDVVVGRELKMIALEKEVERLKSAAQTKEGA
jgi:PAS domain S-box-containing protein